jgi:hypothetical protein
MRLHDKFQQTWRETLHNSKEMDQAQQDILQSDVLKKLGALESSSRNSNLGGHKQILG